MRSTVYVTSFTLLTVGVWVAALTGSKALRLGRAQSPAGGDRTESVTPSAPPVEAPTVLWYHRTSDHSVESLQLALSSGLISHVLLAHGHAGTAPIDAAVRDAVGWVHTAGKQVVWVRHLWPDAPLEGFGVTSLLDPNYYVAQIEQLRREARQLGVETVGLDCEPYGGCPLRASLKSDEPWDAALRAHLERVIDEVVRRVGRVDVLLPAGSLRADHPYNILARLGDLRISENTYYDHPETVANIRYPFEIFGAFVRPDVTDPNRPGLRFYRVADLFDHSERWSSRHGVMLYTDGTTCTEVARDLHRYLALLERRAAADARALGEEVVAP